jgi:hypothetical protein
MMMQQLLQLLLLLAGQLLLLLTSSGAAAGSCAAARKCCDGKDPDCVVSTLRKGTEKIEKQSAICNLQKINAKQNEKKKKIFVPCTSAVLHIT